MWSLWESGYLSPCIARKDEHFVAVFHNITERKRAEESLRESEERYRTVANFTHDWEYWIGTDDNLLYVSPSCERITGYSAQEFIDDHSLMERIIHPDDLDNMVSHFHEARKVNHESSYSVDFRIIRRDGQVRWINHACRKVLRDDAVVGLTGVIIDLTERKRVEERLQEYEKVVEGLEEMIAVVDKDYRYVITNRKFLNYRGLERDQIVGHLVSEILNVGVFESIARKLDECFQGKVIKYDMRYDYALFGEREYQMETFPIEGSNGVDRVACVLQDVTELKQAEEERKNLNSQLLQAQKMEAIGTLAGGIAHDFNNLLTIVMGFSELLLAEKEQDDPQYADLQKIFHAAKNGADLVQRLLMFSRKSEPKPVPMDLNKQIVQVEKLLRRTIPKMIEIRLDLSPDLPRINADPSQVEQVLMNLAVNARDAMPDNGKLTVRTNIVTLDEDYCRLHVEANPGEYVLLEISDTGHGMDKETCRTHIRAVFHH